MNNFETDGMVSSWINIEDPTMKQFNLTSIRRNLWKTCSRYIVAVIQFGQLNKKDPNESLIRNFLEEM